MAETALAELVVWHGTPSGVFPSGEHTYPADLDVLTALAVALREDLAETHLVPIATLSSEESLPLRLANLRAFLAKHGGRLEATLGHERVKATTLAHGARRVERLRALGAPDVIVDNDLAELTRVASASWKPVVDPYASVSDVMGTASIVDVDSRRNAGIPLTADADIACVVLLAAHCCILPDAKSVEAPWLDTLDWVDLPMSADDDPVPEGVVRVRPAIYAETVDGLAFADVRAIPEAISLAPGGALLRVQIAANDDEA